MCFIYVYVTLQFNGASFCQQGDDLASLRTHLQMSRHEEAFVVIMLGHLEKVIPMWALGAEQASVDEREDLFSPGISKKVQKHRCQL